MNLIEKYKSLPEASNVPDEVWDVQRIIDRLSEIDIERQTLTQELLDAAPNMLHSLLKHWSPRELIEAGLMDGDKPHA